MRSLAGWALSSRDGGPRDDALEKLRQAVEELLPFVVDKVPRIAHNPSTPAPTYEGPVVYIRTGKVRLDCRAGGDHWYDIRTQTCNFCGCTYRDILGREPEFMGKR